MSEAIPYLQDGFRTFEDGIDSGQSASTIAPTQCSFAINATMRGGFIHQRPGYKKRVLNFGTGAEGTALRTAFEDGKWQVAKSYVADSGKSFLVVAIGGKLFKVDVLQGFKVQDISVTGDANPTNRLYGWMVQAENYLVFQDGQSRPIIFNGSGSRRATFDEIKAGTVMAYARGRIWYATEDGLNFRATDIVRGPSGTPANRYRDAVLKEVENTFLNEGGDFSVPNSGGPVRAMVTPSNLDASLGQGPLQVVTEELFFSINAPILKETWKDVTYPIQTVSEPTSGAKGALNSVGHNGDVFFRAEDGVRSFILARREFGGWGNTPISREMERVLERDQRDLLFYGSAVVFDNRLLMTCSPFWTDHGVYHRGLAVLDFDLVSSLRNKVQPAWDGLWTGLQILQLVTGKFDGSERCFAFVLNDDEEIELWEITRDELFDNDTRRIVWAFETGSFSWGDLRRLKRLETGTLFVNSVVGQVDFDVKWRPDGYPCWIDWHSWSECSNNSRCETTGEGCLTIRNYKPQYRPDMRLPQPPDTCDDTNKRRLREFFESQVRIQITGPAVVQQGRFYAIDRPQPSHGQCRATGECVALECCELDPLNYRSDGE